MMCLFTYFTTSFQPQDAQWSIIEIRQVISVTPNIFFFFEKKSKFLLLVSVGNTNNDEMCNFYLMYWVEGTEIMSQKSCFSLGPPVYSWGGWILGGGLSNIPDSEASTL